MTDQTQTAGWCEKHRESYGTEGDCGQCASEPLGLCERAETTRDCPLGHVWDSGRPIHTWAARLG